MPILWRSTTNGGGDTAAQPPASSDSGGDTSGDDGSSDIPPGHIDNPGLPGAPGQNKDKDK